MTATENSLSNYPLTSVEAINQRVRDMIREQYSLEDEIQLLRTAPSPEFELWNAHVEACRDWGREQKARLGLKCPTKAC